MTCVSSVTSRFGLLWGFLTVFVFRALLCTSCVFLLRVGPFFLSHCYLGCKCIHEVCCVLFGRLRLVRVRFFYRPSVFHHVIVLASGALCSHFRVLVATGSWQLCVFLNVGAAERVTARVCGHGFPIDYRWLSGTFSRAFQRR